MRLAWILLLALPMAVGDDLVGPLVYSKRGVRLDKRTYAWKKLSSIHESPPSPEDLRKEYDRRAKNAKESASAWVDVGEWAREFGQEELARKAFTVALEFDSRNADAKKALGETKKDGEWVKAIDVYTEKEKFVGTEKKARRDLADWCRDHSLFDQEWEVLVGLLVEDGWNRDAIKRIKRRVEKREPTLDLTPPLAGRWLAVEDKTKHHQIKVWAIYAIDFVKVNSDGELYSGSGKSLSDFHGWNAPIYAAADGTVTHAQSKFPDMPPGKSGKFTQANTVTLHHGNGEYTDYGHLKKGSVVVKVGDKVKKGQLIGRVGNSGASGHPHLHFTMMIPVHSRSGRGGWVGVPYTFTDYRIVRAFRTPCDIKVTRARPQEGWTMIFPAKK